MNENTNYAENSANGVPDSPQLAPRGYRFLAFIIDWTILIVFSLPYIFMVYTRVLVWLFEETIDFAAKGGKNEAGFQKYLEEGMQERVTSIFDEPIVWASLGLVLVLLIVQVVLRTLRGQTIGKMIMGIQIVNAGTFEKEGFLRVIVLRTFSMAAIPYIFNFLPGIGPLLSWAIHITNALFIFRSDRRCIHDLIAGTTVISVPKKR